MVSLRFCKILIVDDTEFFREKIKRTLNDAKIGYKYYFAKDGKEAISQYITHRPNLTIMDINMPKMDGFEVLRMLREHPPEEKWQPVIIISARTELEDVKKGLSLEAEQYILKPCSVDDILKAIKIMVGLIPQHKPLLGTKSNKGITGRDGKLL